MKKLIAVATIAVAGLTVGGTAFAGEVNGNGDPTPINNFGHAQSICAFSGLNDDPTGQVGVDPNTGAPIYDPSEAGRTQNWGHTRRYVKAHAPAPVYTAFLAENSPGVTCNGRTGIVAVVTGG